MKKIDWLNFFVWVGILVASCALWWWFFYIGIGVPALVVVVICIFIIIKKIERSKKW